MSQDHYTLKMIHITLYEFILNLKNVDDKFKSEELLEIGVKRQTIECGVHEGKGGKERNLKRAPEAEGSMFQ